MKVLALPVDDRPREKLARFGAEVLSDAELLALTLGSGTKGKNVLELSREVLERFGGLKGLCTSNLSRAYQIEGIGNGRMSTLIALGEIVRRVKGEKDKGVVRLQEAVEEFRLRNYEEEMAFLLFLDGRLRVIGTALLGRGNVDKVALGPNEVPRIALSQGASRFALLHVHPSGIPLPSKEDIRFTEEVTSLSKGLKLRLYDHFILAGDGVFSFRENGLL